MFCVLSEDENESMMVRKINCFPSWKILLTSMFLKCEYVINGFQLLITGLSSCEDGLPAVWDMKELVDLSWTSVPVVFGSFLFFIYMLFVPTMVG